MDARLTCSIRAGPHPRQLREQADRPADHTYDRMPLTGGLCEKPCGVSARDRHVLTVSSSVRLSLGELTLCSLGEPPGFAFVKTELRLCVDRVHRDPA